MMVNPAPSHRSQVVAPHDGMHFHLLGLSICIKTVAESYTVYEAQIPPHFGGLPAHLHRHTAEWYYMLGGTLAFTLDDATCVAPAGTFVQIDPQVVHTFWNPSAVAATVLSYRAGTDFADYLTQMADLVVQEADWPPADMSRVYALAAQYDQFPPEV